ncbi:mediator of RNA polymerase II transcription subunit 25 [Brachionus plicatilis]|uniref:Mediator of RNA polymerase II transcription subunit 25 n=1 Tax=Brachionus plicatilis TaxID=10195 RepID=A0A3M7QT08_BRAPC|nr:mediator of RNA polymerase II transcription subunit 25 [Brachionus plicatilis]
MPGYEQMQQQQRFQTNVQQPQPQQQQYQQYQQAAQPQQSRVTKIWEGWVEWYQKVQNDKIQHSLKANLFAKNIMDSTNRQLVPEVPLAQAQTWPKKISLQLLSQQIFGILNGFCQPPTRDLYLVTEGNNQELKQTLSTGAALINFASLNQEIKILIATVQNDQIICKIPSDQSKSLNFLKEIVKRQKQHQQQHQQPQRMPQPAQGLNPEMLQQGQLIIQSGQNSQIIGQVPPQNWINQPQQQQPQQIYLQQQTQQQSQGQQQNYQPFPF